MYLREVLFFPQPCSLTVQLFSIVLLQSQQHIHAVKAFISLQSTILPLSYLNYM